MQQEAGDSLPSDNTSILATACTAIPAIADAAGTPIGVTAVGRRALRRAIRGAHL